MKAIIGSVTASLGGGWWRSLRRGLQSSQENRSSDAELSDLPHPLRNRLQRDIESLLAPEACRATISTAVQESLNRWRQQPQAGNALVILANPLEPLDHLLSDALSANAEFRASDLITPLAADQRRDDPLSMAELVREAFRALPAMPSSDNNSDEDGGAEGGERATLVLIPALDMLFLRCIGGWESIEVLRSELVKRPDLFWVIGCNRWAWRFLDAVAQAEACFGAPVSLPRLGGDDLKPWLLSLESLPPAVEANTDSFDWQELADLAKGVSSIAARLWLDGLRVEEQPNGAGDEPRLIATMPALRSLPSLVGLDRYVLHAVLIHGRISRRHLIRSLGDADGRVEARTQWLLRQGILETQGDILMVSPLHYRRIASELANNNFFVESD
ncbi:MAG: hypothetical protein ACRC1L_08650 [Prochlorococcaceae cyanobacterium]